MKRLLPFFLLLASCPVLAESGSYRVEVIVFLNLLTATESAEVTVLRDFSRFPDLENTQQAPVPPEAATGTLSGQLPAQLSTALRSDLPDDLRLVSEKSNEMDNAWRRLRSSQDYRPLAYAAWQQNRVDYYPPLRIHDQQVMSTELRPPTPILLADLTATDPLAAYRSTFYHLDGSLQLRRSRFLHLFLDLELREEKSHRVIDAGGGSGGNVLINTGSATDSPHVYGVHGLKQNRQISTSQMQYFDSPYFGVLVYVTAISAD